MATGEEEAEKSAAGLRTMSAPGLSSIPFREKAPDTGEFTESRDGDLLLSPRKRQTLAGSEIKLEKNRVEREELREQKRLIVELM
ncbi:hypothetical protein LTR95_014462 [Oleoguttula sp. CCFEE 5521]